MEILFSASGDEEVTGSTLISAVVTPDGSMEKLNSPSITWPSAATARY